MSRLKLPIGRWFKGNHVSKALVLAYHRITTLPLDPQLLSVTPEHFAEHLAVLHRDYRPARLSALAEEREGEAPLPSVVITFDDGYGDNLQNAKPLLERYDIPATVFIATGSVGSQREFWWDELERLLLLPGTLPETLYMSINGRSRNWFLGEYASYTMAEYERHRGWNVEIRNDPTPRQKTYRSLCQLLRPLPEVEQQKALDTLAAWAGAESGVARPTHRTLLSDQVAQLVEGGLIEVGSHSVTHPVFSALPSEAQRSELVVSKAFLEEIVDHPVTSFAYPYGSKSDYTKATTALVQEAGFDVACANFAGSVRAGHDLFQLPRVLVRDSDGAAFSKLLHRWLHG